MRNRWLIPALALALGFSMLWGVSQFRLARQLSLRNENNYQRAFQELGVHSQGVERELGRALVTTSANMRGKIMANLWREAHSAQEDIGQLPVAPSTMVNTQGFFTGMADFSRELSERNIEDKPLTAAELTKLKNYYREQKRFNGQLNNIRNLSQRGRMPWSNTERTFFDGRPEKFRQNTIFRSFQALEGQMPRLAGANQEELPAAGPAPSANTINQDRARQVAMVFVGAPAWGRYRFREMVVGSGTQAAYRFQGTPLQRGQGQLIIDVSRKEGEVLWMLRERHIPAQRITAARATAVAKEFLARRGFPSMTVNSVETYNNTTVINLAPLDQGVAVYPEIVRVQVAMDNAEVTGYNGSNFVYHHRERGPLTFTVQQSQARDQAAKNLQVQKVKRVLIRTDEGQEDPAYEVRGRMDGDVFLVYINARTGAEERITRLSPPEPATLPGYLQ